MGVAVKGESHESEPPSSLRSPAVSTKKPLNITFENCASTNGCARFVALMVVKASKSSKSSFNFCCNLEEEETPSLGSTKPQSAP
ncbi:hypothetical protein ACFX13_009242 [Malus domestica]